MEAPILAVSGGIRNQEYLQQAALKLKLSVSNSPTTYRVRTDESVQYFEGVEAPILAVSDGIVGHKARRIISTDSLVLRSDYECSLFFFFSFALQLCFLFPRFILFHMRGRKHLLESKTIGLGFPFNELHEFKVLP